MGADSLKSKVLGVHATVMPPFKPRCDHAPGLRVRRSCVWLSMLALSVTLGACSNDAWQKEAAKAEAFLARGEVVEAVVAARAARAANAERPESRLLLARALLAAGDAVSAEAELERAEALGTSPQELAPFQAQAWIELGQSEKVLQRHASLDPQAPTTPLPLLVQVARAHSERGQFEPAQALLDVALSRDPASVPARLLAVRLKAVRGDSAAALADAAALAQAPHATVDALALHAELLARQQPAQMEAAIQAYRQAVARDGRHGPAQMGLLLALMKTGAHDAAQQQVTALRKALPGLPAVDYLDGLAAFLRGDLARARDMTDRLAQVAAPNAQTLLLGGAVQARLGHHAQAETLLTRALAEVPQSMDVRRELAMLQLQTGRAERVPETLGPALEQHPGDAGLWSLLAQAHSRLGAFGEADRAFAQAAKLRPGDLDVRASAAQSQIQRGRFEPGLRELESVAREDVGGIRSDLALVTAHVGRGERGAALQALDALDRKRPGDALTPVLRGQVLLHFGDRDGARQAFEQALARDGKQRAAAVALAELDIAAGRGDQASARYEALMKKHPSMTGSLAMALAEMRMRAGAAPSEVQAAIDRSVQADPNDRGQWLAALALQRRLANSAATLARAQAAVAAVPDEPVLGLELASAHLARGERSQALAVLNQLATRHPRMAEVHLRLAAALGASGDLQAARKPLERAHELAPDSPTVLRGVVALALAEGRVDAARSLVAERQRRLPREPLGWELQAEIENGLGQPKAAAGAYTRALERGAGTQVAILLHRSLKAFDRTEADRFEALRIKSAPDDALFITHLAETSAAAGDRSQAERHYRRALELQPGNAALMNNLAELMVQRQDPQALSMAQQAAQLAPFMPEVLDTYASALAAARQLPQAVRVQTSAVDRAPSNAVLRLNLARLMLAKGDKVNARQQLDRIPQGSLPPNLRELLERTRAESA